MGEIGTRCSLCGTAAPKAFAAECDRPECEYRLPAPRLPDYNREYLLLASYCGDDRADCSDARPCSDCLAMCNVFKVVDESPVFVRELGPLPTPKP